MEKDTRTRAQKARDTMLAKYGDDYFSKLARKAGANSPNRPFRDPEVARRAVRIRWEKQREAVDK